MVTGVPLNVNFFTSVTAFNPLNEVVAKEGFAFVPPSVFPIPWRLQITAITIEGNPAHVNTTASL